MSSHHIVRDEQEPALLILDFDAIDREHLLQLMEWSPLICTNEKSAEKLMAWGHKIDYCIASNNFEPNPYIDEVILLNTEESIIRKSGILLQNRNAQAINIIGNPEVLPVFALPELKNFQIVLFEGDRKISKAYAGRFKKWWPSRTEITVQPLSMTTYLSTEGFLDNLDNELLTDEVSLTTDADQMAIIHSNVKPFLVAEPI